MKELLLRLQEPFASVDIEWRVGSTNPEKTKGLALAYVTNRAIMNRLDNVCGVLNWKNEFKEWREKSQLCGISIFDKDKKEWVTKWDGADNTDFEPTKGGLSDSMKRAAYQWGIGRYLYKLPAQWKPIKKVGKSYQLVNQPSLPAWALPSQDETKDEITIEEAERIQPDNSKIEELKVTLEEHNKLEELQAIKAGIRDELVSAGMTKKEATHLVLAKLESLQ